MKTIQTSLRQIEVSDYYARYASLDDVNTIVDEDAVVVCDGKVVLGYRKCVNGPIEQLRETLNATRFGTARRATKSKAMMTQAGVFGWQPRMPLRPTSAMCRKAGMAKEHPTAHDLLVSWTTTITEQYKVLAPDAAARHQAETEARIPARYRLPNNVFTSGIVNKSNQLPYHYDKGNFKGAWSAMLALTEGITGGYLVLPEYDLAIAVTDGSLSFFDGQARIHGVTPFQRSRSNAERYTVVWYSLQSLWQCLAPDEELRLANQRQTRLNRRKRKPRT